MPAPMPQYEKLRASPELHLTGQVTRSNIVRVPVTAASGAAGSAAPPLDQIYYLDGHRTANPLTHAVPRYGILPTIADMIATMVTDREQVHLQNLARSYQTYWVGGTPDQDWVQDAKPQGAAAGTYAITLPMSRICELLSCRLARDILVRMAAPTNLDPDGVPIGLAGDANQEAGHGLSGRQHASSFLQSDQVWSVRNESVLYSPLMLHEISRLSAASRSYSDKESVIRELAQRRLEQWMPLLDVTGDSPDGYLRELLPRLNIHLARVTEPRRSGERPEDATTRVLAQVEHFKQEYLGSEDAITGEPRGGRFKDTFSRLAEWQVERFTAMLALETLNILNGRPIGDAQAERGGKPGYYLDFLAAIREVFSDFIAAVQSASVSDMRKSMREDLLRFTAAARQQMLAQPGGLFWRGKPQQRYLDAEQYLVDFLGASLAMEAAQQAASQMRSHVEGLIAAMHEWSETLFTGKTSVISALVDRIRAIQTELRDEQATLVRETISDPDYLNGLYYKYSEGHKNAQVEILSDLEWRYELSSKHEPVNNPLALVLRDYSYREEAKSFSVGQHATREKNFDLLVERCRRIFAEAYDTESVLGYLMGRYRRPDEVAAQLIQNSEPALALKPSVSNRWPIHTLSLATATPKSEEERAYLDAIQSRLKHSHAADPDWFAMCDCEDRCRLLIMRTLDQLPVEAIGSLQKARADYMSFGKDADRSGRTQGRPALHVFPALVNAVRFEDRLAEIGESPRQLCDDVTVLMEDIQAFRLFVRAWSLCIISVRSEKAKDGQELSCYHLDLGTSSPLGDLTGAGLDNGFRLSLPLKAPDLFAALLTFIYDRREAREDIARPIDYGRVNQQCDHRRDQLGGAQANAVHLRTFLETVVLPLKQDQRPLLRDIASVLHLLVNDELRELLALGQRGLEFFRMWDGSEGLNFGQLARAFSERLADECKLDLVSFSMEGDDLYVTTFETSQLLQHTPGIAKRIPMLLARMTGDIGPNVERVREILMRVTHAAQRIALLVMPVSADVLPTWREAIFAQIQAVHAIDVIVPSREQLRGVFAAKLPPAALRRLIFSQVNLEAVSPFKISGAVPDTMFFGRELELRTITEHIGNVSYALIGGRRIGKTSILHRLHRVRLPAQGFRSYFHEASSTPTRADFLKAAARVWLEDSSVAPRSFTELLDRLPHDRPLVFLIDEADKLVPEDAAATPHRFPLFAELRSLAQSGQCQFVIAGERILRETMLGDSTGPLYNFATEILIGRLPFSDVRELILRPFQQLEIDLPDEEGVARRVFEITAGHPNIAQRLCHRLIRRLNQRKSRTLDVSDVEATFADPDFVRKDFLTTYWEQATILERLASLVLARDSTVSTLEDVTAALRREGIQADLNTVDTALERLVDLRNILLRTSTGYEFAVSSFTELVKRPQWLDNYISRYRDTYQLRGDVVPRETTLDFGG